MSSDWHEAGAWTIRLWCWAGSATPCFTRSSPGFCETCAGRASMHRRPDYGLSLDDDATAALIEHGVDLVTVLLDAWTPPLYGSSTAASFSRRGGH